MIVYTRTTHNFNNITREWEEKPELKHVYLQNRRSSLGEAAVDLGSWMSLDQIANRNKEFGDMIVDSQTDLHPLPNGDSPQNVIYDLAELEKLGIIMSKSNTGPRW